MFDESAHISAKTWTRSVDGITKDGFSDGVVDGQKASFQTSFDIGYSQGFDFGFKLGYRKSMAQLTNQTQKRLLNDPRMINCQICLDNCAEKENIGNLFNKQKEQNDEYLKT